MFGFKRRRRLALENILLRETLDWYANSSNWRRCAAHTKGDPVKWIKSPAAFDRGLLAKSVLSQLRPPQPTAAFWRVSVPPPRPLAERLRDSFVAMPPSAVMDAPPAEVVARSTSTDTE